MPLQVDGGKQNLRDRPPKKKVRRAARKTAPSVRPQTKTPVAAPRKRPYSPPASTRSDQASGGRNQMKRAETFKRTSPKYHAAVAEGYRKASPKRQQQIRAHARGPERKVVRRVERSPERRAERLAYQVGNNLSFLARFAMDSQQHDPKVKVTTPNPTERSDQDKRAMARFGHVPTRKGGSPLLAELEGHGHLAKTLSKIADDVVKRGALPSTGAGPNLGGRGTKSFRSPKGTAAVLAPPAYRLADTHGANMAGRIIKNLINFPAQAVSSAYVPVAGAVEAAQGRPKRIKKFAKDIAKTDPIYNAGAAAVNAAKGDTKAAKSHLRKAGKSIEKDPGYAILEIAGAKGTVGRGVGKTMRSGVAGKRVKRAGSIRREPAVVPGTRIEQRREYSPDAIKKARQVHAPRIPFTDIGGERAMIRRAAKTRKRAHAKPDPDQRIELLRKANRQDPRIASSGEVRKRVDARVDVNEGLRRVHRTRVGNEVHQIVKKVRRKDRAAVSVVAQNITKASKDDIKAYVEEIKAQHDSLDAAGQRANTRLQRDLGRIVKDPKADLGKVQTAARAYEKLTAPLQAKLTESGMLAAGRGDKAKLIPYAVRHMGATHDDVKGLVLRRKVSRLTPESKPTGEVVTRTVEHTGYRDLTPAERAATYETVARHVRPVTASGVVGSITAKDVAKLDGERLALHHKNNQSAADVARIAAINKVIPSIRQTREVKGTRTITEPKLKRVRKVAEEDVPLSAAAIRAHMKHRGVEEPAFLTQAPNQRGARNFNIRFEKAQAISKRRRTGGATLKGAHDAHPDTLTENAVRAQGLVDATDGFRGFVKELGVRDSKDEVLTHKTKALAEKKRANLEAETGERYRSIRLNPFDASGEQLQALLDDVNSENQTLSSGQGEKSPVLKAVEDAIAKDAPDGPGGWALIPEAAASQLQKHLGTMGSTGAAGKVVQMLNSNFRKTVLTTSVPWAAGNVVEASFRTALMRAGPLSYLTARKALKGLSDDDLHAMEEAALRTVGGAHFSAAERTHRHTDAEQFRDTKLEGTAQALGKFWRAPGPKYAADAYRHFTQAVLQGMGRVEAQFQTAMLGKAIRNSEIFDDKRMLDLSQKAVDDVVKGLKDTNNVVAFGREVDRAYGAYSKDSPELRMAKAYYTPFIAWYLNSIKFVTDVLPRDHPLATALIVSAERATEEWRKDHGLDMWIKGAVPGWLQGSIPMMGGSQRAPHRYLPFGAFGDPLATTAGQFLPQYSGVILAGMGLKWNASPIAGPGGAEPNQGQKAAVMAQAFLGGQIPFLSLALRVKKKGLVKAVNPLAVTSPAKKKLRMAPISKPSMDWAKSGSSSSGSSTDWAK